MFLDTSFCIDLFREYNKNIQGPALQKLKELKNIPIYLSVFVICELHTGANLSKNPKKELKKVELLIEDIQIVYPNQSFAVLYGETEAYLRKKGSVIPIMDLLIGISAKQYGLPLITRDYKHFNLIPGLVVERYL